MANPKLSGDASDSSKSSWDRAHQMLVGFARTRAGLDLEEGKWLLAAAREHVDRRLGYASFVEERVAVRSTEKVWLDAARGRAGRDVERLVSGRVRGSLPTDPADDRLRRHVLRFEVSGEVLAAFRDAIARLRRDAGASLDDDAALLLMACHVLGGRPTKVATITFGQRDL